MSSKGEEEIDIDDPDFWQKWAKKADLDVDLINKVIMTLKFGPSNKFKRVKLLLTLMYKLYLFGQILGPKSWGAAYLKDHLFWELVNA